jgi:O-antigen/teichoic acid export membrane protein
LFVRGHLELRRQLGMSLPGARRVFGRAAPEDADIRREFRRFITVVYWQTNLDLLPKHFSVLLAGSLLGPAGAGMFRLAREFSSVLSRPAMMLREVMFPDLARMLHSGETGFSELGFRAVRVAGAAGLGLVLLSILIAEPVLAAIGSEYTLATTLVSLLLLSATFELAGAPLRAAAYAMGRVAPVLHIHLLGVVVYFAAFALLAPQLGLEGIGIAACLGTLLTLLLMTRLIRRGVPGPD